MFEGEFVKLEDKTNAMRMLDREKIEYSTRSYVYDENDLSGLTAAEKLGCDPESMFKTLVLRDEKSGILLCLIPVAEKLDIKNLSKYSGHKKLSMLHVNELQKFTGYVRGGCSPIGMKKDYPCFADKSISKHDGILISAGRRGLQIAIDPKVLIKFRKIKIGDFVMRQ